MIFTPTGIFLIFGLILYFTGGLSVIFDNPMFLLLGGLALFIYFMFRGKR